jgi:hypothetical protein
MHSIVVLAALALVACSGSEEAASTGEPPAELQGWRQAASGKPPTPAEFAAVMAACQDRQKARQRQGASLDQCLADLGLRRVP